MGEIQKTLSGDNLFTQRELIKTHIELWRDLQKSIKWCSNWPKKIELMKHEKTERKWLRANLTAYIAFKSGITAEEYFVLTKSDKGVYVDEC